MGDDELKAIIAEAHAECIGRSAVFDYDLFLANLVRQRVVKEALDILRALSDETDNVNSRDVVLALAVREIQDHFSLRGV